MSDNLENVCLLKDVVEREEIARKLMMRHYELNGCNDCSGKETYRHCFVAKDYEEKEKK